MLKLLFALSLLFLMAQAAGLVVELALHDTVAQLEEIPPVAPEVKRLMQKHGVTYFDWNGQEYGFWRGERWCPAR